MDLIKEEPAEKDFSSHVSEKVEERPSSPSDCAICLEQLTDKSFTNSCLHMFCFHCLLAWSKVKPECPLCKQDFCSIIHNIRSMTDYDEYHVPPPEARLSLFVDPDPPPDLYAQGHDFFTNHRRFFSYRTTIMSGAYSVPRGRSSNLVIQPYVDNLEIQADFSRLNTAQSSYSRHNRREIYVKELETLPPPSGGRYRECSPDFYRENETQVHRLGRWLLRELTAVSQIGLRFNTHDLLRVIIDMLPVYSINSATFYTTVNRFLGGHTMRFIREFRHFAMSPFEIDQYDRECVYVRQRTGSQLSFIVTVGRDDSEEVQVIPNSSNHSLRPWIDVNDLSNTQPSLSSGIYSPSVPFYRSSSQASSCPASNAQPCSSQSIINISDSENDDCVIIDEVRPLHETILLDDSDGDQPNSRLPGTGESVSTSVASTSGENSNSTGCLKCEKVNSETSAASSSGQPRVVNSSAELNVVDDDWKSRPSCSYTHVEENTWCSSSVVSTEASFSENGDACALKKGKRKRSKKYYKLKNLKKTEKVTKHIQYESPDLTFSLTASSEEENDRNDSDWEASHYKRKKRTKKPVAEKCNKKRKRKTTVADDPKSVKKKTRTNSEGNEVKSEKKNQKSIDSVVGQIVENSSNCEFQTCDAPIRTSGPRLRSVVRRVENRCTCNTEQVGSIRHKNCDELEDINVPSTSKGLHSCYCQRKMNSLNFPRATVYTSDSD